MWKPTVSLLVVALAGVDVGVNSAHAASAAAFCSIYPPPPEGHDPAQLVKAADVAVLVPADSTTGVAAARGECTWPLVHCTVRDVIDSGRVAVPVTLRIPGSTYSIPDFNQGAMPCRWVRPAGQHGSRVALT